MNTHDDDPQQEPQSYEPEFNRQEPEEGLLETCVSVITAPVPTLRRVVEKRPLGWAFIVIVGLAVASGLIQAVSIASSNFEGIGEFASGFRAFAIFAAIIGGPIFAVLGLALSAGVYWVMSRILGGQGPYSGLFTGLAFAGVTFALTIPVSIVALLLGIFGAILSPLVGFAVTIWYLVLSVIVIRENNGFTTVRAVVAVLVPLAILFAIIMTFVILVFVLIAAAAFEGGTL